MMIRNALIAGAYLSLIPAAALAQAGASASTQADASVSTPAVGATVLDSNGVTLGTIASITPQAIVLDVEGKKIAVPPTSVGSTPKGLAMAMTKQALQAAQAQQEAAARAAIQSRLVAGAPVAGLNGAPIGSIKSTNGDMITLTTSKGEVTVPSAGFSANANGQLIIGMTQAQLDAAIAANGGGTTTGDAAAATTSAVTGAAGAVGGVAQSATGAVADTAAAATSAVPSVKADASVKAKTTVKPRKRK
jgi:hypothetical protein